MQISDMIIQEPIFKSKTPFLTQQISDDVVSTYTEEIYSPAIVGPNAFGEIIDNSINGGSTSCSTTLRGTELIHADDGRGFRGKSLDETALIAFNEFIRRPIAKPPINTSTTNELAGVGGSRGIFQIGLHKYVGFVNQNGQYIAIRYIYDFGSNTDVSWVVPDINDIKSDEFGKNPQLTITVEFYEVSVDEFTQLHGLGRNYLGFFNIISLYNDLKFTPSYDAIMDYTRKRYNEKDIHINIEVNEFKGVVKKLFYPISSPIPISSMRNTRVGLNSSGENFHIIKTPGGCYHVSVWCWETIRTSQTHKMEHLHNTLGKDNIMSWIHKYDKPGISVFSPNLIMLFEALQVKGQMWESILNNLGFGVMLLPSSPNNPSSKNKDRTADSNFLIELRVVLKRLVKSNIWDSSTKTLIGKKEEDLEIDNFLSIITNEEHEIHPRVALNVSKLMNITMEHIPLASEFVGWTKGEIRKKYDHNLDILWRTPDKVGKDVLVEWQVKPMDDVHYSEFNDRLQMNTGRYNQFKTVVWVHGGVGTSTLQINKFERNIVSRFGKSLNEQSGIEKIVMIDKKYLFAPSGWKFAKEYNLAS